MLHRFNILKLPSDVYTKSLNSLCAILIVCIGIWFFGPYLTLNDYTPFAQADKRIYIILSLLLLWLLKFLIIDLDVPNPTQYDNDPQLQKKLTALQKRFTSALEILQTTRVTKQGESSHLIELPWYLLLGPHNAGKSALLMNSKINFILNHQTQSTTKMETTENCHWWSTQDVCIIDVPGKFLSPQTPKESARPYLWQFFLRLIKKFRASHNVEGIIIALPLPELLHHSDNKHYQVMVKNLLQRLREVQKINPHQSIPCHIIITKCDLIPGFVEFFSESSIDEITQIWGVSLNKINADERVADVFVERFDALIKKINQQLIWRLQHERDPMVRPLIKDFPLQMERLKEITHDFVKKIAATQQSLSLYNVCLTSALQDKQGGNEPQTIDEASTTNITQILKDPVPISRAYFIKQLIMQGLVTTHEKIIYRPRNPWKRYLAITASIITIFIAAIIFGHDFKQGMQHTYTMKNNINDYQLAIQQIQDPEGHLAKTLTLLNTLQSNVENTEFSFDLSHIMNFYTHKSAQKASEAYQQALRYILLPEIRDYLGEHLKNPVNRNADNLYSTLKAYLMLGDATHFKAETITHTIRQQLPNTLGEPGTIQFLNHLQLALHSAWIPLPLNQNLIQETRKYLTGLPNTQLGYIILKNLDNNTEKLSINLGINNISPTLVSHQTNEIPAMFTVKNFNRIVTEDVANAAVETITGNWILGNNINAIRDPNITSAVTEQIRINYINNYISVWEGLLASINIATPKDLTSTDALINSITKDDSPLLQLLQTVHDNTFFEPIISTSPKLHSLGLLVDKNQASEHLLLQIFSTLQLVHQFIQPILAADNEKKAAFEAVSNHMLHQGQPDVITQLLLVAEKCPEPVRSWLDNVANDSWRYLMQDAAHYIDFSWQRQVGRPYRTAIANHYPFNPRSNRDVNLHNFVVFFGNPGIVVNFYHRYLQPFIDTSKPEWHWKTVANRKLPFSEETLHQLQTAMQIHHTFFPNGDNKLLVEFTLQPHKIGKNIKKIKITLNDKLITDTPNTKSVHYIAWPGKTNSKLTTLSLTMKNQKTINKSFAGDWGWFKLISQSFEAVSAKKAMVLNLSTYDASAKYLVVTNKQFNPYLSLNLRHFHLPQNLSENQKV